MKVALRLSVIALALGAVAAFAIQPAEATMRGKGGGGKCSTMSATKWSSTKASAEWWALHMLKKHGSVSGKAKYKCYDPPKGSGGWYHCTATAKVCY